MTAKRMQNTHEKNKQQSELKKVSCFKHFTSIIPHTNSANRNIKKLQKPKLNKHI